MRALLPGRSDRARRRPHAEEASRPAEDAADVGAGPTDDHVDAPVGERQDIGTADQEKNVRRLAVLSQPFELIDIGIDDEDITVGPGLRKCRSQRATTQVDDGVQRRKNVKSR
jgi:hypothetical protein